ncbi:MAG: HEAT repeat domain-containing protein [Planctomycetota bacterium]|nr:HEAT repeat domain-containing protein [Planctomycetota bacterium]
MLRSFTFLFLAALTLALTFKTPHGFSEDDVTTISSEPALIAILAGDAAGGDKALACKRLAIYGTGVAAPELAKLLTNEQLASWARIALEAIPGKEADDALRGATANLNGKLLVGVINSIGVRRDKDSVPVLIEKLNGHDVDVASAAAIALGRIGGDDPSNALRKSLANSDPKVRSLVAEGCVLCAERFLAEGNATLATTMYDEVRKADVPKQRLVEATRGSILARKQEGIPLLVEQLRSTDPIMFQLGLQTAREIPGKELEKALLAEVGQAAPEKAALIVTALADRKEFKDLPTMIQIASKGPKEVRVAALGAISRIGDASCIAPLLSIALADNGELLQPAKAALVEIPAENVAQEIVKMLPTSKDALLQLLIEVVGLRRVEATSELVKGLDSPNKAIRTAALESLGSTVPQDKLAILIEQVVAPKNADDATVARQALETAAIRMPDREACATQLATAAAKAPLETKTKLLEILGAVGGTKALETIAMAAKESDPQLKDIGSKLLGDWMTIDAAPVLLDLAKTGPADKFQVRAMRGYIRFARQFVMPDKDRVDMCAKALEAAKQPAEQKLVVENLARYPSIGTLKLAIGALQIPEVKADATQAIQTIAKKLSDNKEVRELMSKAGLKMP